MLGSAEHSSRHTEWQEADRQPVLSTKNSMSTLIPLLSQCTQTPGMATHAATDGGFYPIASHSLSKHPWLRSSPGGRREIGIPRTPTHASRKAMSERCDDSGPSFDVDDLLAATDYEEEDGLARMLRRMREQHDHALGDRRDQHKRAVTRDLLKFFEGSRAFRADLTFEVDIRIRYVKPYIHRRLSVSAGMSLHAFVDRVLIVAFGYARGEHGYIVHLPAAAYPGRRLPRSDEDTCFVPEHAGTVDMMHVHMFRGGHCAVPAQRVLLCDLLREPGDTIKVIYDLGDRIEHLVTLAAVHEPAVGGSPPLARSRRTVLLGGARAGIPENPGNVNAFRAVLDQIVDGSAPPGSRKHRRIVTEWSHQSNWRTVCAASGLDYDPAYFDAKAVQRALDAAADEAGGGDYSGAANMTVTAPFSPHARSGRAADLGVAPPRLFNCAQCNALLHEPLFCGMCKDAAYCGRDCQRAHWKAVGGHRLSCAQRKGGSGAAPPSSAPEALLTGAAAAESTPSSSASGGGAGASTATVASERCAGCGEPTDARPQRCGLCRGPAYCGVGCQRKHWAAGHRQECPAKKA